MKIRSGSGSGGGMGSKNVVRPGVRTGQPARAMRPAGVSQLKRFPADLNRWDSQGLIDERVFVH
jgi:hypothetical protein